MFVRTYQARLVSTRKSRELVVRFCQLEIALDVRGRDTVFVLLAGSREGVLPTILSRAQVVRFNPVPTVEVEEFLRGRGAPEPALAAALGRGSVGLALRYAEDPEIEELRGAVFGAGFSVAEDFEGRHGAVEGIVGRAEALGAAREKKVLASVEEPDRF